MRIRKLLAASTTLAIAALGTSAVAADAAAGQDAQSTHTKGGHGHAYGHDKSKGDKSKDDKSSADKSKGDKSKDEKSSADKSKGDKSNGDKSQGDAAKGGKAGGHNPPGNNGTVKIAPLGDFDGIPNNTPHVGCSFLVEWYGYDEGADIISTVTFAMQAPTADVGLSVDGPSQVFVGGDPASGAGTDTGLDGRQQYTLAFDGAPHPKQGYHVKLTVNTPYSQGADKKSKVFWVTGCEDTAGTGGDTSGDTGGDTGTGTDTGSNAGGDTSSTSGSDTQVAGEQASTNGNATSSTSSSSGSDTQVAGVQATAGNRNLPTQVNAGGDVLDFVTSPVPLLVVALGLALGVIGLARRSRRA